MKKYLLPALLVSSALFAQNHVSVAVGADIKNAMTGSKSTNYKSALDYTIDAHIVKHGVDINLGMEAFPEIKFWKRHMGLGYHIPICFLSGTDIKFSVIPSFKGNVIVREVTDHEQFFTFSGDVSFNWDLSDKWAVQIVTDILPREDLKRMYNDDRIVISNYFKVVYKFNVN